MLLLAQAILCEASTIATEDAVYKERSPKPHKAAAGQPSTSATENKDQCHHERASAPASCVAILEAEPIVTL